MDVVYRASLLVFLCHHVCQVESRARRDRTTLSTTPYPPSSSTPNPHRFVHLDCGSESSRLVQFLNFSVSPSPIRAPGRARLTTLVNVTERLPMTLSADVSVSKYFYGIPLKIPCFSNIGTCHYKDVCGLLETLFPTDKDCPRVLKKHRIPCRCPFEAGLYHLKRWLLPVPALRGIFESLATIMGRVLSLAFVLIGFSCLVSSEYDCSQKDFCSAGDECDREYVLGRFDFCSTDSNHDGVINMFEIVNIYNQIVKDGKCDRECFLAGLGYFPACRNEVIGSYNLLSGYDGDPSSFSTTDADLWYADLVKYEGKVPVTAAGFRKRFRVVYKMIGDPTCEVPYL